MKIAEQAVASNLKLLEGFHLADKKNKKLLLMLTQGFASYSLRITSYNVCYTKLLRGVGGTPASPVYPGRPALDRPNDPGAAAFTD